MFKRVLEALGIYVYDDPDDCQLANLPEAVEELRMKLLDFRRIVPWRVRGA